MSQLLLLLAAYEDGDDDDAGGGERRGVNREDGNESPMKIFISSYHPLLFLAVRINMKYDGVVEGSSRLAQMM